jgi:hypothetical protein
MSVVVYDLVGGWQRQAKRAVAAIVTETATMTLSERADRWTCCQHGAVTWVGLGEGERMTPGCEPVDCTWTQGLLSVHCCLCRCLHARHCRRHRRRLQTGRGLRRTRQRIAAPPREHARPEVLLPARGKLPQGSSSGSRAWASAMCVRWHPRARATESVGSTVIAGLCAADESARSLCAQR